MSGISQCPVCGDLYYGDERDDYQTCSCVRNASMAKHDGIDKIAEMAGVERADVEAFLGPETMVALNGLQALARGDMTKEEFAESIGFPGLEEETSKCHECRRQVPVEHVEEYWVERPNGELALLAVCDECVMRNGYQPTSQGATRAPETNRSSVAISPDRMWMVALDPEPSGGFGALALHWSVMGWNADDLTWYREVTCRDTGQDAQTVLDAFLKAQS